MSLVRLRPIATPSVGGHYSGRCAACGKPATAKERTVRMYGQVFHSHCAFADGKRAKDGR